MEHLLDVRHLQPPEPLERILDALADMPPGDQLCIKHCREPHPLYGMLKRMGYQWQTTPKAIDDFEILIWEEAETGQSVDSS